MKSFEINKNKIINNLLKNYDFIEKKTLTKSLCERNIDYLQIGNEENVVLLAGAFHGMEWITSLLLLKFIEKLSYCIKNNKLIYGINFYKNIKKKGVIIIPCVNPDGVEISINGSETSGKYQDLVKEISKGNTNFWQANARGVDLNHNFNAGWEELHKLEQESGIKGPAPTRYGGIFPESEPETKAIAALCREVDFSHAIAFHSQGEEIYWNYNNYNSNDAKIIAEILAKYSNYKLCEPEGLAVGGGFKDWFITELKKPAFTIEVGKGENPLPLTDFNYIYNKIEKMLFYSIIL